MTDPRLVRPAWRNRTNVDALTIAALEHAEQLGGHRFIVTQGSYQSSVAASAGTHDRGGVIDLSWCGHDACIRALRRAGFAAWHRTPAQGPWGHHIHAVVVGHPYLAPVAARQVDALRAGKNGLASGAADDGPREPVVAPVWPWPPAPPKPPVPPKPKPKSRGKRIDLSIAMLERAAKVGPKAKRTAAAAAVKVLKKVKPR